MFLYSSELTERGVAIVLALPGLRKLILYDCAITEEELATLAKHHPDVNAEIYFTRQRSVVEYALKARPWTQNNCQVLRFQRRRTMSRPNLTEADAVRLAEYHLHRNRVARESHP